jgi:hypothetical protein
VFTTWQVHKHGGLKIPLQVAELAEEDRTLVYGDMGNYSITGFQVMLKVWMELTLLQYFKSYCKFSDSKRKKFCN